MKYRKNKVDTAKWILDGNENFNCQIVIGKHIVQRSIVCRKRLSASTGDAIEYHACLGKL